MVNLVAEAEGLVVRRSFPHRVRVIDHQWIPLSDGTRLAARIWLPDDAERHPVPAVIEYIPYRHRDFTLPRDEMIHPWFAGHGYAAIRLDIRGSGNSEGQPMDEYVAREQDDMLEALAWIAAQDWCSGTCGMIGISWGGFSALQTAFRRPPELGAIITLCSTDDRYADDVHYMSGCLLRNNLAWGGQAFAYAARPPDPAVVGDAWKSMWRERLDNLPFHTAEWLSHQRRDAYWKHGSVAEDFSAIRCPVYAVSGWADGYTNTVLKLMAGLDVPRRCLIGPWAHAYPNLGVPGPAVGFLQDCLNWWDRWLKGIDNGIDREPAVRLWLQDPAPPATHMTTRSGRWIGMAGWPPAAGGERTWWLDAGGGLGNEPGDGLAEVATPLVTGMMTGEWNPHGIGPELPGDQRSDDARSRVFMAPAAGVDLAIVGCPRLRLRLASGTPAGTVVARLVGVAGDGSSALITWGCLNLAHRAGHEDPEPMEPGVFTDIVVTMNAIAQVVPADWRLRLALSCGSWPLLWPAPELTRLTVDCSASALELPLADGKEDSAVLADLEPAEIAPRGDLDWLRPFSRSRRFVTDVETGTTTLVLEKDDGAYRINSHGLVVEQAGTEHQSITEGEPLSSRGEAHWKLGLSRGGWQTSVDAVTTLTCDAATFLVTAEITAREGSDVIFSRRLARTIPRDNL